MSKHPILTIASFGAALMSPLAAAAAPYWGGGYPGPQMMWNYGWHGWFLGPIAMLLFWGLIIAAVVFLVRRFAAPAAGPQAGKTPLDILKERFARGDISKDEFEERRQVLAD